MKLTKLACDVCYRNRKEIVRIIGDVNKIKCPACKKEWRRQNGST